VEDAPLPVAQSLTLDVGKSHRVSGLLLRPEESKALYVMAHGAGAGMRHSFLEAIAAALAVRRVATLRYQFPYVEAGQRRPDPPALLEATVRGAVRAASELAPELPLIAGGKSMGGRITSMAQAREPLPGVGGVVFLGFPLHPAGAPGTTRADHLTRVNLPMLFIQGTRDKLAPLDELRPVVERLGVAATLHVVEGADHGFDVLKRSGRSSIEVIAEIAEAVASWPGLAPPPPS
jgi:predicted alpha/beta-hydrolase family hydrolase